MNNPLVSIVIPVYNTEKHLRPCLDSIVAQTYKDLAIIPDTLYYYLHYEGQTTKRYNYSLWECLIELFNRYSQLDTRHLAEEGLRIRSFLFIRQTIFLKMIPSGLDKRTFADHLRKMSAHPYMVNFFKPLWLGYGWKYEILYQLLRYHRYGLLYSLLRIKSK